MSWQVAESEPALRLILCTPPDLPTEHDVKELRLALVCYGGVSLAIYMHGITKELEKLVRASRTFVLERPKDNPFSVSETERAYFAALEKKSQKDGYRTLVTVDIISGTSAGGINGIYLAKALANGAPQEGLRELWLSRASILKLMALKAKPLPPLAGKKILGWLQDALDEMDANARESLMPPGLRLDLFVTTTDAYGWDRPIPIEDPHFVTTLVNKVVFAFHDRDGVGNLDAEHTPALAFAARATSCFPGAFPPTSIAEINPDAARDRFSPEFCRAYELTRPPTPVTLTYFIDGGVLDNYPFRNAIRAIPAKPAATEVERKLLFIEPDPPLPLPLLTPESTGPLATMREWVSNLTRKVGFSAGSPATQPPQGEMPGYFSTVWDGLSKLPRRQPIADALDELSEYNRRVRRVREMIEAATAQIMSDALTRVDHPYQDANRSANQDAISKAGPAFAAYLRLKLYTVIEGMADGVCQILEYPEGTAQAAFVRAALLRWGELKGLLGAQEVGERERNFLRTFDLGYGRRRLTFAISRINQFYSGTGLDPSAQWPSDMRKREALNGAKRILYQLLCQLRTTLDVAEDTQLRASVEDVFGEKQTASALEHWDVEDFARDASEAIDGLASSLADFLNTELHRFGDRIYETLRRATDGWPEEIRRDLLAHYIGFPSWDAITFSARTLSDVGELDEVDVIRISPLDTKKLVSEPTDQRKKLRGVAIHHFAAFFAHKWRENDYLWGRLDGAERLLWLIGDTSDDAARTAFRAILQQDRASVSDAKNVIRRVEAF